MAVLVKTLNGLAYASVKTRDGLAVASVKAINGLDTTASGNVLLTSQTLGTLRSNYTGRVGFSFVAASNFSITELGRWVVSGNSQSHVLRIQSITSGGTVVNPIDSVTVNTSGAPVGAYLYGTLSSPVSIVSGTTYLISSDETSGGDQWYDNDTTATIASVGNTLIAAGQDPAGFPHGYFATIADRSYVPVNAIYT